MPIESIQIATNRYAPAGSEQVLMYDTGASGPLTLGQLVQAVCIRTAAALEAQSVNKMNTMTAGSVKLDDAAGWLTKIAQGTADWPAAKAFLVGTMGIAESEQSQQEEMIDLQTMVNRRDVAFSTSSNVVRALGTSSMDNAQNF